MKKIGILSDTHGCFDDKLRNFFKDVDELWHAGDIGNLATADAIASFKPLRAVHGNIDDGQVRLVYPRYLDFECEGASVLMTHIGIYFDRYNGVAQARIVAEKPTIFVCGHSHILKVVYDRKYDLLHINPGAAGVSGFHRVRTAVRLVVEDGKPRDLEVGEWKRDER